MYLYGHQTQIENKPPYLSSGTTFHHRCEKDFELLVVIKYVMANHLQQCYCGSSILQENDESGVVMLD